MLGGFHSPLEQECLRHVAESRLIGDDHRDVGTAVGQVPGRADAATAVAARPGQHNDRHGSPLISKGVDGQERQIAASVLHHLKQVGAGLLDRDPIHLAHLIRRDRRCDLPICGCERRRLHVRRPRATRYRVMAALVEPSCSSGGASSSVSSPMIRVAKALPSSTPH